MKFEVIMAGFGGQGIMMMGQILAYGAMMEGKEVSWIPSYGPEMRGGTANCMVVISDVRIPSPVISLPEAVVVMNKPSMIKFVPMVKCGGLAVINTSMIDEYPSRLDLHIYEVEANKLANELGNMKVANMVALGMLVAKSEIVKPRTVINAIQKMLPPHRKEMFEINEKAFYRGMEIMVGAL